MTTLAPPRTPQGAPARRRRWPWVVGGSLVVLALLVAGGIWYFFRDDAPEAVSLEAAIENVGADPEAAESADTASDDTASDDTGSDDTAEATTDAAAEATEAAAEVAETATTESEPAGSTDATGIEGTWTVDTETGTFDYQAATGTFVGFRIEEELDGIGSTEAVGRTPAVTGSLEIEGTTLVSATFEADLTQITTDRSQRDDQVQRALETGTYPTATFTLTEPLELGTNPTSGPLSLTAIGELTIHGVTMTVEFPLEAQYIDGSIVVVGSLDISFADYGVSVPSAPIVVSASDNGPIELQLLFQQT